jgi:hypothetical protein
MMYWVSSAASSSWLRASCFSIPWLYETAGIRRNNSLFGAEKFMFSPDITMPKNQRESGVNPKENERWRHILLKGLPLASIATLLMLYACSAAHPEKNESNTRDEMKGMEQAENNAASDISTPPLDNIVPLRTETATFAFG